MVSPPPSARPGREPKLQRDTQFAGDFDGSAGGTHDVLLRPDRAEHANAQSAAAAKLALPWRPCVQVIQVRQIIAAATERGFHPSTKAFAVAREAHVVGGHLELQGFANQFYAAWICLQEANVRVTSYYEIGLGKFVGETLQFRGRNPGR